MKVIITGADHPTGLGTARALYGLEVDIIGLCENQYDKTCRSRFWNRIVQVENDPEAYLQMLIFLGDSEEEKPFLIPSQDSLVQIISENRDDLSKYYEFVFPEKNIVDLLMDKTIFHEWADSIGLPVPESHIASSKSELDNILNDMKYPLLLKPLFRTKQWDLKSPSNKIFRLNGKEEVKKIDFDLFDAVPKILVQQWIPGADDDVYFCLFYFDRKGREVAHYTGRKLLQWHIDTGNTAICVGIENEEVYRLASEIFQSVSFKGLGSIEFKRSVLDNQYYITEPTVGRNNLQSYVAVRGGINLTKIAFFDALNKAHEIDLSNSQNAIWIEEKNTLHAWRYLLKRKNFPYKRLRDQLRNKGKRSFAYFDLKDPLPFIHLSKSLAFNSIKRIFGKKI